MVNRYLVLGYWVNSSLKNSNSNNTYK